MSVWTDVDDRTPFGIFFVAGDEVDCLKQRVPGADSSERFLNS